MDEAIFALITAIVGAVGVAVRQWLQATLTPKRLQVLGSLTQAVVTAADEVGRVLEMEGPEKYNYAEMSLKRLSKRIGLKLTDAEVNALIHAVLGEHREAVRLADSAAQFEEFLNALETDLDGEIEEAGLSVVGGDQD